jgi:hypothetical protein
MEEDNHHSRCKYRRMEYPETLHDWGCEYLSGGGERALGGRTSMDMRRLGLSLPVKSGSMWFGLLVFVTVSMQCMTDFLFR